MTRCPLLDLARDATAAVGVYVGLLKTHIESEWAKVSPEGFDARLAAAKARFEAKASMEAAADRLAEREAATEVSEPLWRPSHPTQSTWMKPGIMYGTPVPAALCADEGAPCSPICDDCRVRPDTGLNGREERHARASVAAAQRAGEPPEVEPSPAAPSGGLTSVSEAAPIGEAVPDIFRSGGQTHEYGTRPRISVPRPGSLAPLDEAAVRRIAREEAAVAIHDMATGIQSEIFPEQ